MDINLTWGAVEDLVEGIPINDPVLQLVDTLQISKGCGPTRFRLRMSDGRHLWSAFLLATQLNHLSEENLLVPHCVCLLKKTTTSTLSDGRRVVIILDMEILQSAEKSGGLIGNPTVYKERLKSSPEEPTSAAQLEKSSNNRRAAFCPRGGGPASPMKTSAEKPSPSKFSPSEASSSEFSPMKGSSFKCSPPMVSSSTFSPAKGSPAKFSPTKASPSTFSPAKASPSTFSPAKASPSTFFPAKASPSTFSPAKASPSTFSPAKASPSTFFPATASPSTFSPAKASPSTFFPATASPSTFSPAKASPSTFSPAKASPSTFSPAKASPSTFSPAKASTSKFSPVKGSPSKFSPTKASSSSPGSSSNMIPIAQLNPYQSRWTIRARVVNKSSIRNWNNSRGEGKLFSFEIVDESGEMRITAFNNEVDKFFSLVEQGKVYYISKATLKVANKQFNTLKHDYEMTLHAHSSIVPCADIQDIPAVQCDFVPIAELEHRDKDAIIDVIGVCKTAEDVSRITTKNSREISKRTLHLIDTTGKMVAATLWGEKAEKFDGSEQPVVAIKGARLSDFGGISLSTLFSSTVMVNPDIPEAFRLRAWYDQGGYALTSQSLTETKSGGSGMRMNWKTLSDVKKENLGQGEKADYFSCVATLLYSRKDTCLYRACPSSACNKKVLDQHNGWFRCEKCNREFANFKYRLMLSANLADFGDNQWVTCFQETAEALLGHSAETLGQLRETDEAAFDAVFQKANFTTHIFKNRVKLETYNDESRVKVTVMEVQPVNHREYSRMLLNNIHNLIQ